MTWTKLGDDFAEVLADKEISRSARMLLVELYIWSNRRLKNGAVPRHALRMVTDSDAVDDELKELEAAGLIDVTSEGWQLDWSDQEPSDRVRERRELARQRKERWKLHISGDHMDCHPQRCSKAGTRSGTQSGTREGTTPRPDPTRPVPKGDGEGAVAGTAAPPAMPVEVHAYLDDGSGLSCGECNLPANHPSHALSPVRGTYA